MKHIAAILTTLVLTTGCSYSSSDPTWCDPTPIRIAPNISRVTGMNFDEGDLIGLSILKSGVLYCENAQLRYDGAVFLSEDLLWYNDRNEKSSLTAYYPYMAEGAPSRFSIRANQRLSQDHAASDLLAATADNITPTEAAVSMTFFHLLTKLTIKITNNSDNTITEVVIKGTRGTALVELAAKNARVDATSTEVVVYPFPTTPSARYDAILIPQTTSLQLEIETSDNRRYSKKFEATELQAGLQYTIEATINNREIQASISGIIQDWNNGGTIPPEGESELTYQGEKYRIVQFSNGSTWMAESLRYIPQGRTVATSPTQETGIWYPCTPALVGSNDQAFIRQQGLLYNLETAAGRKITADNFRQLEGTQGICPAGWHIPTAADYNALMSLIQGGEVERSFLTFAGIRETSGQYFGQVISGNFSKGYFIGSSPESETFSADEMTFKYFCFLQNNALLLSGMNIRSGAPLRCVKNEA